MDSTRSLVTMSIVSIHASDVSKITSGQVIVDLVSVVKELVENSIDAGADKIQINFKSHGLDSVGVTDNGGGIDTSDFESLCLKHHTSKLSSFEDLSTVGTLGFRGEAMSSLCAVAKISVITCSETTFPRATQLQYNALGALVSKSSQITGMKGTTVTVTDMFHEMPVRRTNFVRHIKREFTKTLSLLMAYFLSYTSIRFTVFNTNDTGKKNMVMGTSGLSASIKDVLISIYGSNGAYGLVPIDLIADNIDARYKLQMWSVPKNLVVRLTGYVSDYSFGMGRSATDRQFLTINKRPFSHKKISKVINEVYKTYNPTQYPAYVLDLELDSSLLDVNVTPDKRSVMIQCENLICEIVREELSHFYASKNNFVPKSVLGVVQIGSNESDLSAQKIAYEETNPEFESDPENISVRKLRKSNELKRIPEKNPEKNCSELLPDTDSVYARKATSTTSNSTMRQQEVDTVTSEIIEDAEVDMEEVDTFHDVNTDELRSPSPVSDSTIEIQESNEVKEAKNATDSPQRIIEPEVKVYSQSRSNIFHKNLESPHAKSYSKTFDGSNDRPRTTKKTSDKGIELLSVSANGNKDEKVTVVQNVEVSNISEELVEVLTSNIHIDTCSLLTKPEESNEFSETLAFLHDFSEVMEVRKSDFANMKIVGQFNSGFIIVSHNNRLLIVDQHASDEIFNYEQLMKTLVLQAQPLVIPRVLELSAIDEIIVLEKTSLLRKNGFIVEEIKDGLPGKRVVLTGVPVSKNIVFDDSDLQELVHKLHENNIHSQSLNGVPGHSPKEKSSNLSTCRCTKVDKMIASRACRKSIMIGSELPKSTMSRVVKNLATLDRPWNCPHGRPTIRHLADFKGRGFSKDYEL